jgi:hypothetical protein
MLPAQSAEPNRKLPLESRSAGGGDIELDSPIRSRKSRLSRGPQSVRVKAKTIRRGSQEMEVGRRGEQLDGRRPGLGERDHAEGVIDDLVAFASLKRKQFDLEGIGLGVKVGSHQFSCRGL